MFRFSAKPTKAVNCNVKMCFCAFVSLWCMSARAWALYMCSLCVCVCVCVCACIWIRIYTPQEPINGYERDGTGRAQNL